MDTEVTERGTGAMEMDTEEMETGTGEMEMDRAGTETGTVDMETGTVVTGMGTVDTGMGTVDTGTDKAVTEWDRVAAVEAGTVADLASAPGRADLAMELGMGALELDTAAWEPEEASESGPALGAA